MRYSIVILIFLVGCKLSNRQLENEFINCIGEKKYSALVSLETDFDNYIINQFQTDSNSLLLGYKKYLEPFFKKQGLKNLQIDSTVFRKIYKTLLEADYFKDIWLETLDSTGYIVIKEPDNPNYVKYYLLNPKSKFYSCLENYKVKDEVIANYLSAIYGENSSFSIFDNIDKSINENKFEGMRKKILLFDLFLWLVRYDSFGHYR